ncbi:MAG TPA: TIR domain-containing protein [Bacillota bacterium]|nr:TIR domain-containing protein [Bacillota bacterium]
MGRKIFISYKYADSDVKQLSSSNSQYRHQDTVRSYVDLMEEFFKQNSDHIYKGESDGEDLSQQSDSTIRDKLYDRIYDSTVTIVMLSPNMQDACREQKFQWIPQEISYSLREQSRTNSKGDSITSSTNAMLAVVLPDQNGSYSYFLSKCTLCGSNCTMYSIGWLFKILRENTLKLKHRIQNDAVARDLSFITVIPAIFTM